MFDLSDLTIAAVVLLVFEILGVLFSLDAVMRPRSSQGAIAWGVSLIALPIITVPLYLVFGRTHFHGYAETLRAKQDELGESFNAWVAQMAEAAADTPESLEAVASVVRRLTSVPFTRGNRVELLVDGEATYRAMLEAIASAESYIFVQFFIVRDDETGRALRDALVARAKAGVRVHFLYDEIGSLKLPPAYLDVMREASIEVSGFKTTQGFRNRFQINFRNHRKLLIVDGRTGFIGGHNLGDEYLGYRDTHMRIDGPAAQAIQFTFLLDWYWATRRVAATGDVMPTHDPKDQSVAIVETGPADRTAGCSVLFATLINSARCRLWITSPYFVPDDVMVRSLQAAALRGVDVRVLVPRKGNHRIVELAASTYYASMIDTGVQFYKYHARFLHQKVILVDDALAGVGTVNLDNRSIYLNFEATGLVADEGVAREIAAMLEDDFEHSTVVERDFLAKKPPYVRVAAGVARLASPLL